MEPYGQTVDWVWESPFATWACESSALFWIRGKPASGKSTVIEHIGREHRLQECLRRHIAKPWDILRYFFFNFGVNEDLRNNFEGFLRSLLFQLVKDSDDAFGVPSAETQKDRGWLRRELQERLISTLSERSKPICILLDGLDEYQDDKWDLAHFLRQIASPRVKLGFASRPFNVFDIAFTDLPNIRMQDWNTRPITKMVNLTIQNSIPDLGSYKKSEVIKLATLIPERAQGVFLWARFAVKELLEGWSIGLDSEQLQEKLEQIPQNLDDIYNRIVDDMSPDQKQQAARMLQLVCYAKRTLTVTELCAATDIAAKGEDYEVKQFKLQDFERFARTVLWATGGLIDIFDEKGGEESNDASISSWSTYLESAVTNSSDVSPIREVDEELTFSTFSKYANLTHRTVRTYLESGGWSRIINKAHKGTFHAEFVWLRICRTFYLPRYHDLILSKHQPSSTEVDRHQSSDYDSQNFLVLLWPYVSVHMLDHAFNVEHRLRLPVHDLLRQSLSVPFMESHLDFASAESKFWHHCQCLDGPRPVHPLNLIIAHGLGGLVRDLLLGSSEIEIQSIHEWKGDLFLETSGKITMPSPWIAGTSANQISLLCFAAYHVRNRRKFTAEEYHTRFGVLRTLLKGYSYVRNAELAFALEHCSTQVIELLLSHFSGDSDMKLTPDTLFAGSLKIDRYYRYKTWFADRNPDLWFRPLWFIVQRDEGAGSKNVQVIDLFLERGEDINAQCGPMGTALHSSLFPAEPLNYLPLIRALIAKGADVNAAGPIGRPLEVLWIIAHTSKYWVDLFRNAISLLINAGAVNQRCDPGGFVPSKEQMLSFGTSEEAVKQSRRIYKRNLIRDGDDQREETNKGSIDEELIDEEWTDEDARDEDETEKLELT